MPQQKCIDIAEQQLARLRLLPHARAHCSSIQRIFSALKYVASGSPVFARNRSARPRATTPQYTPPRACPATQCALHTGRPVLRFHRHRRLALIRDADRSQVFADAARAAPSLRQSPLACAARSPPDRAPPIPPADKSARALSAPRQRCARAIEHDKSRARGPLIDCPNVFRIAIVESVCHSDRAIDGIAIRIRFRTTRTALRLLRSATLLSPVQRTSVRSLSALANVSKHTSARHSTKISSVVPANRTPSF